MISNWGAGIQFSEAEELFPDGLLQKKKKKSKTGNPLNLKPGEGSIPITEPKNRVPRLAIPLNSAEGQRLFWGPSSLREGFRNSDRSANEAIKDATNLIKKKESGNLGGGSSIGETNARASWLKATANSPAAKSMTHGKPTFSDQERWDLHNKTTQVEQQADATKGVPTIPNTPKQQMNLNLEGLDKASATRIGNMQSFMNNASPRMKDLMIKNPQMAEDLLRDAGKGIGVEGGGGGLAAGAGALGKLMVQADQKKKKDETETIANVNTSKKGRFEYDPFAWNIYSV